MEPFERSNGFKDGNELTVRVDDSADDPLALEIGVMQDFELTRKYHLESDGVVELYKWLGELIGRTISHKRDILRALQGEE